MTDKTQYFHFTLGPVQSFVGQARRTRDFWAGSFILSWLSGVAMLAVKAQIDDPELKEKCILFPEADPNFLSFIEGNGIRGNEPKQGSIPNRFKAEVSDGFKGQLVVQAVQDAWQALAETVYDNDIKGLKNEETKTIWDRQVKAFWDMSWTVTSDEADSSSLDRRKNWRSQFLPDEPGIKCSLMGDWQELSGVVGVRRRDREARERFWLSFYNGKNGGKSDFQPDGREHLCAMAFIKRRFVRYFADFKATVTDSNIPVHGWQVPSSMPSVSYIAAAPWFAEVISKEGRSATLNAFITAAKACSDITEYNSTLRCVDEAAKAAGLSKADKGIDGNMFHNIALDNPNICADQHNAQQVKKALGKLTKIYGAISPFYAVLMMDGDSLGKQMSIKEKQPPITEGLQAFTQAVPDIVRKHNGFLIYAGGDDVLALLPLEDALSCAAAVRFKYDHCFKDKPVTTTISAAIIYTHINTPLKNVLRDAHEVLDHVAKDGAGRDALAVRVYKGSGIALEWAKKWSEALVNEGKSTDGDMQDDNKYRDYHIGAILDAFNSQETTDSEGAFSNKFFYKIRQRFALFANHDVDLNFKDNLRDVLCMDFIQSADNRDLALVSARKAVDNLLSQCDITLYNRVDENGQRSANIPKTQTEVDAALLVRFLAQKGIERGGQ